LPSSGGAAGSKVCVSPPHVRRLYILAEHQRAAVSHCRVSPRSTAMQTSLHGGSVRVQVMCQATALLKVATGGYRCPGAQCPDRDECCIVDCEATQRGRAAGSMKRSAVTLVQRQIFATQWPKRQHRSHLHHERDRQHPPSLQMHFWRRSRHFGVKNGALAKYHFHRDNKARRWRSSSIFRTGKHQVAFPAPSI
jgi:hypothetical protein